MRSVFVAIKRNYKVNYWEERIIIIIVPTGPYYIIFCQNIIQSPAISQLQTVTPAETDKKPVRLLSNQPQDITETTYVEIIYLGFW